MKTHIFFMMFSLLLAACDSTPSAETSMREVAGQVTSDESGLGVAGMKVVIGDADEDYVAAGACVAPSCATSITNSDGRFSASIGLNAVRLVVLVNPDSSDILHDLRSSYFTGYAPASMIVEAAQLGQPVAIAIDTLYVLDAEAEELGGLRGPSGEILAYFDWHAEIPLPAELAEFGDIMDFMDLDYRDYCLDIPVRIISGFVPEPSLNPSSKTASVRTGFRCTSRTGTVPAFENVKINTTSELRYPTRIGYDHEYGILPQSFYQGLLALECDGGDCVWGEPEPEEWPF
jgi:hypothetical protein